MVGVGYSHYKNPVKAAHEAASKALSHIQGQRCHSCLVFSTVGYSQTILLDEIRNEVGNVPMIGCSGEGVITTGVADESSHCVAVLVIADPNIRLDTAGYPDLADSGKAGRAIGETLSEKLQDDSRCILLLPCGLNAVVDDLISGIEKGLGRWLPIIGGGAGNNFTGEISYQYHNWQIYKGGMSAAILSGDFNLFTVVSHGCLPIGVDMEITNVEGNIIYKLDNRPALGVLEEFMGDDMVKNFEKARIHFCIGQLADSELAQCYDKYIIRGIPTYNQENKSISMPVKMQRGDKVSLCRRDKDKMISTAEQNILALKGNIGGKQPFLVLDFNCAGRGKFILANDEKVSLLRTFQSGLAPDSQWIGFFAFGEYCPIGKRNLYQNYTNAFALFVRA